MLIRSLNILSNLGILAFLAFISALVSSLIVWYKHPRNICSAICGGAVLCYGIQACFGIGVCTVSVYIWLAWAVMQYSQTNEGENENEKKTIGA